MLHSWYIKSLILMILPAALVGPWNDALAGSFKTLETAGLAVDQQITVRSSPKNSAGNAIDMEVYEWQSGSESVTYQCRILSNATTQTLNLSLIGVDGTVLTSCQAPASGSCNTPPLSLGPNVKFQCLVATNFNASPVPGNASYKLAVRRVADGTRRGNDEVSDNGVVGVP